MVVPHTQYTSLKIDFNSLPGRSVSHCTTTEAGCTIVKGSQAEVPVGNFMLVICGKYEDENGGIRKCSSLMDCNGIHYYFFYVFLHLVPRYKMNQNSSYIHSSLNTQLKLV